MSDLLFIRILLARYGLESFTLAYRPLGATNLSTQPRHSSTRSPSIKKIFPASMSRKTLRSVIEAFANWSGAASMRPLSYGSFAW